MLFKIRLKKDEKKKSSNFSIIVVSKSNMKLIEKIGNLIFTKNGSKYIIIKKNRLNFYLKNNAIICDRLYKLINYYFFQIT